MKREYLEGFAAMSELLKLKGEDLYTCTSSYGSVDL